MSDGKQVVDGLYYADTHEWVKLEGNTAIIGVSDYAQHSLHEITYVELPEVGTEINKGDEIGAIESIKASSEIIAPVSGKVTEINESLEDSPEFVNEDPYGKGWFIKVELKNPDEVKSLMDADKYKKYLEELD